MPIYEAGRLTVSTLYSRAMTAGWAVGSAVEHCLDMAGVTGSIPVPPTTLFPLQHLADSTVLQCHSRKNAVLDPALLFYP